MLQIISCDLEEVFYILTDTSEILALLAEKACRYPANKGQKLVWKMQRKLAKLSTGGYCSPSYLFYGFILKLLHSLRGVFICRYVTVCACLNMIPAKESVRKAPFYAMEDVR